jgi:hypothetical protein
VISVIPSFAFRCFGGFLDMGRLILAADRLIDIFKLGCLAVFVTIKAGVGGGASRPGWISSLIGEISSLELIDELSLSIGDGLRVFIAELLALISRKGLLKRSFL